MKINNRLEISISFEDILNMLVEKNVITEHESYQCSPRYVDKYGKELSPNSIDNIVARFYVDRPQVELIFEEPSMENKENGFIKPSLDWEEGLDEEELDSLDWD